MSVVCAKSAVLCLLCLVKVLSHNLYTVLQIPYQNCELEEHFKDDDEGPVSTQGYMPYLNTFILDRVAIVESTSSSSSYHLASYHARGAPPAL